MTRLADEITATIAHYAARAKTVLHPETGDRVGMLKKGFAHAYIPDPTFHQPARDVEKKHGFNGIARRYVFPGSLAPDVVETYGDVLDYACRCKDITPQQLREKLKDLAHELRALNPALAKIKMNPDSITQCYGLIQGATSAFNADDIQYYLRGNNHMKSFENPAYRLMRARMQAHDVVIQWVPSPLTLRRMSQQLFAKECGRKEGPRPPKTAPGL